MKNKLGRKPRADDFRKTIKAKDKNPELENKSLVGIAGKQYTPSKPKKELSIAAKQYSPKINKMNKGGVFKGIF